MITKTEEVSVHFELDAKATKRHRQDLDIIYKGHPIQNPTRMVLEPGDTFHCNYSFTASYHDTLPECLNAVARICKNPKIVMKVDCAALTKQRILIYETLKQLDALIQTVNSSDN
jgi:hypothetical protein